MRARGVNCAEAVLQIAETDKRVGAPEVGALRRVEVNGLGVMRARGVNCAEALLQIAEIFKCVRGVGFTIRVLLQRQERAQNFSACQRAKLVRV